jgi:hypothetical protein
MDDVETTNMLLLVHNDTSTTHVTSTSNDYDVTRVEFHEVDNFVLFNVELNGVVDLNERVGVTDGSAVMCNNVRNSTSTDSDTANLEELVGGLFRSDPMDGEPTLDIVEETEVFTRFFDRDDIYRGNIEYKLAFQ